MNPAVASPMAGNGHNVTFDGRVFIVSQGPLDATGGWFAMVFRPENLRYAAGGNLDLLRQAAVLMAHHAAQACVPASPHCGVCPLAGRCRFAATARGPADPALS